MSAGDKRAMHVSGWSKLFEHQAHPTCATLLHQSVPMALCCLGYQRGWAGPGGTVWNSGCGAGQLEAIVA
ncbi:hypothetical protein CC85DRAFT_289056 [Cutaneotrichosporon oleaginosum]|uniref:Uncharacterized protein n=1 Tax=Cutaneotrichosporon oleaginosum TaxID=879819 RepID=A0A0J1AUH5_9TREE|nr:uncharacterized protein CC85DRAFT_289056 [Cutaneotrichosporon oleaginosum]KLT38924.1 hypothetical protein CC85DRAFT_289056 [Cutaneotrichosporon oleaginosum]TXT14712.1 hypothetical protein COLE_00905 [Cutaneotrichosporon oleaginosum]